MWQTACGVGGRGAIHVIRRHEQERHVDDPNMWLSLYCMMCPLVIAPFVTSERNEGAVNIYFRSTISEEYKMY